ncbi:Serine/threonine kinase [Gonapodya sp. JEL0774]|nr:Serine/threonine kinase [Gonapodya sp. JEL0774]
MLGQIDPDLLDTEPPPAMHDLEAQLARERAALSSAQNLLKAHANDARAVAVVEREVAASLRAVAWIEGELAVLRRAHRMRLHLMQIHQQELLAQQVQQGQQGQQSENSDGYSGAGGINQGTGVGLGGGKPASSNGPSPRATTATSTTSGASSNAAPLTPAASTHSTPTPKGSDTRDSFSSTAGSSRGGVPHINTPPPQLPNYSSPPMSPDTSSSPFWVPYQEYTSPPTTREPAPDPPSATPAQSPTVSATSRYRRRVGNTKTTQSAIGSVAPSLPSPVPLPSPTTTPNRQTAQPPQTHTQPTTPSSAFTMSPVAPTAFAMAPVQPSVPFPRLPTAVPQPQPYSSPTSPTTGSPVIIKSSSASTATRRSTKTMSIASTASTVTVTQQPVSAATPSTELYQLPAPAYGIPLTPYRPNHASSSSSNSASSSSSFPTVSSTLRLASTRDSTASSVATLTRRTTATTASTSTSAPNISLPDDPPPDPDQLFRAVHLPSPPPEPPLSVSSTTSSTATITPSTVDSQTAATANTSLETSFTNPYSTTYPPVRQQTYPPRTFIPPSASPPHISAAAAAAHIHAHAHSSPTSGVSAPVPTPAGAPPQLERQVHVPLGSHPGIAQYISQPSGSGSGLQVHNPVVRSATEPNLSSTSGSTLAGLPSYTLALAFDQDYHSFHPASYSSVHASATGSASSSGSAPSGAMATKPLKRATSASAATVASSSPRPPTGASNHRDRTPDRPFYNSPHPTATPSPAPDVDPADLHLLRSFGGFNAPPSVLAASGTPAAQTGTTGTRPVDGAYPAPPRPSGTTPATLPGFGGGRAPSPAAPGGVVGGVVLNGLRRVFGTKREPSRGAAPDDKRGIFRMATTTSRDRTPSAPPRIGAFTISAPISAPTPPQPTGPPAPIETPSTPPSSATAPTTPTTEQQDESRPRSRDSNQRPTTTTPTRPGRLPASAGTPAAAAAAYLLSPPRSASTGGSLSGGGMSEDEDPREARAGERSTLERRGRRGQSASAAEGELERDGGVRRGHSVSAASAISSSSSGAGVAGFASLGRDSTTAGGKTQAWSFADGDEDEDEDDEDADVEWGPGEILRAAGLPEPRIAGQVGLEEEEEGARGGFDLWLADYPLTPNKLRLRVRSLLRRIRLERRARDAADRALAVLSSRQNPTPEDLERIKEVEERGREAKRREVALARAVVKYARRWEEAGGSEDGFEEVAQGGEPTEPPPHPAVHGLLHVSVLAAVSLPHRTPRTSLTASVFLDGAEVHRTPPSRAGVWHDPDATIGRKGPRQGVVVELEGGREVEVVIKEQTRGRKAKSEPQVVGVAWFAVAEVAEVIQGRKVPDRGSVVGGEQGTSATLERGFSRKSSVKSFLGSSDGDGRAAVMEDGGMMVWIESEPGGQILLRLNFVPGGGRPRSRTPSAAGSATARRRPPNFKRFLHARGHRFVTKGRYQLVRCAACGELLLAGGVTCEGDLDRISALQRNDF